jgi:CheY-like chemotaxis protein
MEALKKFNPDLILSDFSMPHFDGMSALDIARAHCPHTPFIFVSGTIGEERAVRSAKRAARRIMCLRTVRHVCSQPVTRAVRKRSTARRCKARSRRWR